MSPPVLKTIGPWTVHAITEGFANPWLRVESHAVTRPDGQPGQYGVVRFANFATGVLPLASDGTTWLVGQHRFPFDHYSWELPEGGGRRDTDPQISAARELKEETGLTARQWRPLGHWYMSNSVTDEQAFGYRAWGLEAGQSEPEPYEALSVRRVPFGTLLNLCLDGEVRDAFTVLMTLSALAMARRGDLPSDIAALILQG